MFAIYTHRIECSVGPNSALIFERNSNSTRHLSQQNPHNWICQAVYMNLIF